LSERRLSKSIGLRQNFADSVDHPQPEPPPKSSVKGSIVSVLLGYVAPAALGALAVEDPVQYPAAIDAGATRSERGVHSVEKPFDASPGMVGNLPAVFRGVLERNEAPGPTPHTLEI
jgi:hypothetical protein